MALRSANRRDGVRPVLRGSAGLLALFVAWVHVLHPQLGIGRLLLYLEVGTLYDPRPPSFVLIGFVLILGIVVGFVGDRERTLYLGGAALMGMLLLGYVAWHTVLDHGAFWPYIESHDHGDAGVIRVIGTHLREDSVALASKTAEVVLLIVLLALLRLQKSA